MSKLTKEQKRLLKERLNACDTVGEMFSYLQQDFLLFSTEVNGATKQRLIGGLVKGIDMVKPPLRIGNSLKE